MKGPTIQQIFELCKHVKSYIEDDSRASDSPDDDQPGIQLTIGADSGGGWGWQTGDNSFSGGAYHYPHWAVGYIYRDSNCREVAREMRAELDDLIASAEDFEENE